MTKFHPLNVPLPAPRPMGNPFRAEPDSLCLLAARSLQARLPRPDEGKMFGVLVVEHRGQVGYLQAFSGQMTDAADDFVPAVVDYLQPDGYFKTREAEISAINAQIERIGRSDDYLQAVAHLEAEQAEANLVVERKQAAMRAAKMLRDLRRRQAKPSEAELNEMTRESQFLKAEVRRAVAARKTRVEAAAEGVQKFSRRMEQLKTERKLKSDRLQQWLFSQFVFLNARGQAKNLLHIFRHHMLATASPARLLVHPASLLPPAGAGECCEPKLLQYAFSHGMRPLGMATFWWGPSEADSLRLHGHFYPACSGKCKPILDWMLRGIDVAPLLPEQPDGKLEIIYEDESLFVVDKPAGMLSVPGKTAAPSVIGILHDLHPDAPGPFAVHRLDMATSGLLVVARTPQAQRNLQRQFALRRVQKTYTALLSAASFTLPVPSEGTINLPLRPDPLDRPRQVVDPLGGKPALTRYAIRERMPATASRPEAILVEFRPVTGRTHQLRVHSAHPSGLGSPILGDPLYASPASSPIPSNASSPNRSSTSSPIHSNASSSICSSASSLRLCLHASALVFSHPVTGRVIRFSSASGLK